MKLQETTFPIVMETERLLLRKLKPSDVADIFEIYSDEESAKYDDWIPMTAIETAEKMISNSIKYFENKEALRYGIELKETGKIIGVCCLWELDEQNNKAMLYYQINRKMWNNGYASESIGKLIPFIFDELEINRLEAYITPGNDASVRVLEKNGFVKEGLMREMEFYKNKYQDGIIMAMLKSDWKELKDGLEG